MARRPANSSVLKYLRLLAGMIGLADWDIAVEIKADMTSAWWATCEVPSGKSFAQIEVSPSLFKESAEEQRQVMVHELVHAHLFPLVWSWESAVKELGPRARKVANEVWNERSERACDDLARVIAPTLPLPPWKAG